MKTFTRDDEGWSSALDQVFNFVEDIPDDRLKKNYSKEGLQIDEWVAISVSIGGFSSVSWRPLWNNNCRILNRFYKIPSYRFENKQSKISEVTLECIAQQLSVSKLLGFDCAFMSRETKTQAFHHFKKYLPQEWHTPKNRYKMYNTGYQHIMWTSLNGNILDMEPENDCD